MVHKSTHHFDHSTVELTSDPAEVFALWLKFGIFMVKKDPFRGTT